MIDFLVNHWAYIVIALLFMAIIVVLALRGKKQIIYKMLYALIDEAERQFGSGTGKLKFSYVLEKIYGALPSIVRAFITYSMLEKWIENALAEMKEYWKEQSEIE